MCSSLVRMVSSTFTWPVGANSKPMSFANFVLGRTPIDKTTKSACNVVPDFKTTSDAMAVGPLPAAPSWNAETPSPRWSVMPCLRNSSCKYCAISWSKGAMTCGASSTTCTSGMPFTFICSANSSPMKPPPQTTTLLGCFVAIHASMAEVSSMLRSVKWPARSMPGMGGIKASQPMVSTSSSYSWDVSSPEASARTVTTLAARSIETTSVPVCTLRLKRLLSISGLATVKALQSWISPPR
mmetsp:Transcript_92993/g.268578  ORF Transcript_92993/g.268578 Transcript_92993/m.268578 type:complete len:240 (-) Transcript_92993:223-942(-)